MYYMSFWIIALLVRMIPAVMPTLKKYDLNSADVALF